MRTLVGALPVLHDRSLESKRPISDRPFVLAGTSAPAHGRPVNGGVPRRLAPAPYPGTWQAQPVTSRTTPAAVVATDAVSIMPQAMSTTTTIPGQPRSVAALVRSYVA